MNRVGRATIMLSLGAITARLLWSGGFGWFVQQRMFLPLLGAAIVLLGLAGYEAFSGLREQERNPDSMQQQSGPAVGWMLVLPILVLVSVAPTGLGAAAADRVDAYTPTDSTLSFTELETTTGPLEMRVVDFIDRAIWDDANSLDGVVVRLEGLVVNDPEIPDGFKLTRFIVSCCAADGIPVQVAVRNAGITLPDDTWVIAELTWRPPTVPYRELEGTWTVEADAVSITPTEGRNDPYESPY